MNVSTRTSKTATLTNCPSTAPRNMNKSAQFMRWLFLLFAVASFSTNVNAQTTLISPTGDGGFETGASVAANNWIAVNGSPDSWVVGTAPTPSAGARCAYVSPDGGTSFSYTLLSTIQHLYRDITIPAGESIQTLTFKWKVGGEGSTTSDWDNMKVFLAPTSVTPTLATAVSASFQVSGTGAISGMYKLSSAAWNTSTITLAGTPGTTYRLIFSWKSDVSTIAPPSAAIDEVSLISRAPVPADAAPTTFNPTAVTATGMTIGWTDNSTNETGFKIYRSTDNVNFTQIGSTVTSTSTATTGTTYSSAQTNLLPGITYYYRISAVFESESAFLTGSQATTAAGNITSTTTGGNWSATTTWVGGVVPVITDNVTIADGATVTIDNTSAVCNSLTVGQGTSGILRWSPTAAATLTVATDVTVAANGSFTTTAVTAGAKTLNIGGNTAGSTAAGNLVVDGTFDMGISTTAFATTNFFGTADGAISGSGATCNFGAIVVNKGAIQTPTLDVTRVITTLALTTSGARLTITNGTFKLSSASTLVPYFGSQTICAATGRLWLNNASASIQCFGTGTSATGAGSPTVTGELRIDNGTFGYGQGNNSMAVSTGTGVLRMSGGTLNMYGAISFASSAGCQFIMSGGNINVDAQNIASLSTATSLFSIGASATVNWSGGIITIVDPHSAAGGTAWSSTAAASKIVTGGTLRIGDGTSTTTGGTLSNTSGFGLTGTMLIPVLEINNRTDASTSRMARMLGQLNVGTLDIKTNGYLFAGSSTTTQVLLVTGNVTNNGTLAGTEPAGTQFIGTLQLTGTSAETVSGAGTFTNIGALSIANNSTGVTFNQTNQLNANRVNMFFGNVINANKITVGLGGTTANVVQMGNGGAVAGSFDVAPTFNIGTGGLSVNYLQETAARTTGNEIPPSRSYASTTINNTNGVTLAGGNITLSGTLTLTAGKLTTSASNMPTLTNTAVGAVATPSATSYVVGPIARTLPASLVTGSTYVMPVGKATYNPIELVNPTTGGGTVTVQSEVFDANAGGTPGTLMGTLNTTRYWATSATAGAANFTNTFIRLNDTRGTQDAIGASTTSNGTYNHIGGVASTLTTTSILSTTPAETSLQGFYLMGNVAAASISNLAITPSGTQCTNVARTVTATVTPGGAAVTGVTLNYQVNGGTVQVVTMTNLTGNGGLAADNWSGVIPTVTPANATVTWSITATDANTLTKTQTGTAYSDEPLFGTTATATASPTAVCAGGSSVLTATLGATNTAPTGYCAASYSSTTEDDIGQVTFAGINNPAVRPTPQQSNAAATGQYTDFTGITPAVVSRGTAYPMTVYHFHSTTDQSANGCSVFIDFNQNGLFTDSGEEFPLTKVGGAFLTDFTGTITIPASAAYGKTRMRVVLGESYTGVTNCGAGTIGTWGEVEDYIVDVRPVITSVLWSDASITNPTTVTPSSTTGYTATITSAGCQVTTNTATVTVNLLPASPSGSNSTQCGNGIPTAFVASGGQNGQFRWYSAATGGTLLQGPSTATTYGTSISTTTTFYVSESANADGTGCESARTPVTATVNPPDAVSATPSNTNPCTNTAITLTAANIAAIPTNIYTYTWTGTPQAGSGLPIGGTPGTSISVTPTVPGTYTYTVTAVDGSCSTTATTVNVVVKALPAITTATATPNPVCAGTTVVLAATHTTGGAGNATLGTGTGVTSATSQPTAFCNRWAQYWNQTIYTAAELSGAGLTAGSSITSVTYTTTSQGDANNNTNFRIRIGNTANSTLSAFATTPMTTVFGPTSYTHSIGANLITFTTPFVWDGTSNIILDVIQDGVDATNNAITFFTPAADNKNFAAQTSTTSATTPIETLISTAAITGTASTTRLNVVFGYTSVVDHTGDYNWSWDYPGNPGAPLSGSSVTVTPVTTTTYTVTATDPATTCSNTQDVLVTVNPVPAQPTANTGDDLCGTGVPTISLVSNSGFGTPTFKWYSAATGGTLLQSSTALTYGTPITTTTTFYVTEATATCESSPRVAVTQVVNTPDQLSATANTTPLTLNICLGSTIALDAIQTGGNGNNYAFSWTASGGANSGVTGTLTGQQQTGITPSALGTYTYTVVGFDDQTFCTATSSVTVTVNPYPVITSVTGTPSTVCAGTSVTLNGQSIIASPGITNIGTETTTEFTASFYRNGNNTGDFRHQVIFTAAELSAAGLQAGNITSLTTKITSLGSGGYSGYTIKLAHTAATVIGSTFATPTGAYTTCYVGASITPTAGLNLYTFTTPFNWDGTSNLLMDICYNVPVLGSSSTVAATTPAVVSNGFLLATAGACGVTTTQGTGANRPFVAFGGQVGTNQTASLNWVWNPGAVAGSTVTVTPTVTTDYTATATTAAGCSVTSSPVHITVNPIPNAPIASNSTQCGPGVPTASVSTGGANGTYKWYDALTGGTLLQTGGSTYTTSISGTGVHNFYVSESDANCESVRTLVTVTITAPPTLVITAGGATTFCAGGSVSLDAATGSDPSYTSFTWSPATGLSATTGAVVTANPSTTQTYTVTATGGGCTEIATITVTVNPNPPITSAVASPATICAGGTSTLTAQSVQSAVGTATVGTGADVSTLSTAGTPYRVGNTVGNQFKNQYLFLASELQAAGLLPGNINSVTLNIVGTGGGTLSNFSIKMGATALTALTSTYVTGLTPVLSLATYPATGTVTTGLQTHTFTTSFAWDGTSNIVLEMCAQLATGGTAGTLSGDATGFASTIQNNPTTTGCSSATGGGTFNVRPNVVFGGLVGTDLTGLYTWEWNPGALAGSSVNVTPTVTSNYSVKVTDAGTGCFSTFSPVTVTVATVGGAPAATATTICAGQSTTISANATGGGPFTYLWDDPAASTTASITVSPATTTTYSVVIKDACGNPTASLPTTITVNPLPTVSVAPLGPITLCAPATQVLTATTAAASPSYQWTLNGVNIPGANAATYTVSATGTGAYAVKVTDGNSCISLPSNGVSVTINPSPTNVVASASTNTLCAGDPINLTVTSDPATGNPVTILSQNFDGGLGTWTATNNTTGGASPALTAWTAQTNPFTSANTTPVTFNSGSGTGFALSNADIGGSGTSVNTILTSPAFSTVGYTTLSLSYSHYYRHFLTSSDVDVSTDGVNWTNVKTYTATQGAPTAFVNDNVNLNAYINLPSVQVRFRYQDGWAWYWALDNILVTGTPQYTYSWSSTPAGFTSAVQNPTGLTPLVSTDYTVSVNSSNGCSTTASTGVVTVNQCPSVLTTTLFLEGFYRGASTMASTIYDLGISTDPTETDTVLVNLWAPTSLANTVPDYSVQAVLHTDGTATATFPAGLGGQQYYIAIKHRNTIETWSKLPVTFKPVVGYNFSSGLAQAYDDGFNPPMKNMGGGVFALYSGDVNQDGAIEATDLGDVDNDVAVFAFGYNATDVSGDGATDATDLQIVDNNGQLFLFYARPY